MFNKQLCDGRVPPVAGSQQRRPSILILLVNVSPLGQNKVDSNDALGHHLLLRHPPESPIRHLHCLGEEGHPLESNRMDVNLDCVHILNEVLHIDVLEEFEGVFVDLGGVFVGVEVLFHLLVDGFESTAYE